jgi:hypothetical protein
VREAQPGEAYTAPGAPRGQSEAPMQQMNEPSPATERSRRRPPRRRSDDPIPIPDVTARASRTKTVKLHQVLRAYQRAVLDVVEKRMAGLAEAAAEAARQGVAEALHQGPLGPDRGDVAKSVLAHADERLQAMSLRLQQIEEAVRRLAAGVSSSPTNRSPDGDLSRRLDVIAGAVAGLAEDHRAMVAELGRRTGDGVVAVGRVLRRDLEGLGGDLTRLQQDMTGLQEGMDGVRSTVRSMHRTLAWEGMRSARPRPAEADST